MLKTINKIIAQLSVISLLAVPVLVPAVAHAAADIPGGLCAGANLNISDPNCATTGATEKVDSLLTTVINIVSVVVGAVAVFMIIFSGLKFISSGGDPAKTASARNGILYAIIGLVVVAFAQIIVKVVLNKATTT